MLYSFVHASGKTPDNKAGRYVIMPIRFTKYHLSTTVLRGITVSTPLYGYVAFLTLNSSLKRPTFLDIQLIL